MRTLLANLKDAYGMPYGDNPEAVFGILADQIAAYPDHLSRRALQIILEKKRRSGFPDIDLVVQAVKTAAIELDKQARYQPRNPVDDRADRARNLIRSEMGRTAADQGWISQLYSFCERHGRLPNPGEQANLMRQARLYDEAYEETKKKLDDVKSFEKPRSFDSWIAIGSVTPDSLKGHLRLLETGYARREQYASIARGKE